MNYIIFEDQNSSLLAPFSLTHPVFELRCGAYTNLERIIKNLNSDDTLTLIVRDELKDLVKHKYPVYQVNPQIISKGILLNAASIWSKNIFEEIKDGKTYLKQDILVSSHLNEDISFENFKLFCNSCKEVFSIIDIKYIKYLWECIDFNYEQITVDFKNYSNQKLGDIHSSVIIKNDEYVYIDKDVLIGPGTVIDASNGPIIITKGSKIDIGSLIQGPVFIGPNTKINPGTKLRGNIVLGPVCKVGGEITDTIMQGYSNKQHDGFLGHSYICEWVNLGANTNNSNLKNNYGNVRFPLGDINVETKKKFIGIMMGDYSKSGISTMFNTGTYVGVGANIFGGGFQKKMIKSFKWGEDDLTDLDKFIETCKIIKSRRGQVLHHSEISLLKYIYKNNK